ncbi:MAG: hypothetical protein KJ042_08540 [Deltaproteobacteria bacterium]|nr:hypothetical protein [Deltaproteobacteria bacterium]
MTKKTTPQRRTVPQSVRAEAPSSPPVPSSGLTGRPRRDRIIFAVFLLALAGLSAYWGWRIQSRTASLWQGDDRYLIEDAGISVVFAENIARGEGVVYFPDGERVEGFSNPLWTGALVVAAKLGIDPWAVPRPLGIVCTAIALFFGGLLVWYTTPGWTRLAAFAVPPLVGEAGTTVIWAISGLENGMYAATLLASLALFARERGNQRAWPISGFVFFFLALTRPEGMVFGAMAGLFVVVTEVLPRLRVTRRHVVFAALFLAPLAIYQLWRWRYFAWPLPNTFYGKVADEAVAGLWTTQSRGWGYLLGYLREYGYVTAVFVAPLAAISRRHWRSAALVVPALAFVLFFPIYANGDWMREWRFCSIVTALLVPACVIGVANAADWAAWIASKLARGRFAANGALATGLVGMVAIAGACGLFFGQFAPSNKHIDGWVEKPQVNTFKLARRGKYFREIADRLDLRPGSVADTDMGGIGAKSGMVIRDVGRLCDVPFGVNQWDEKFVDDYIFTETRPDIIHARDAWGRSSHLTTNPKLDRDYIRLPEERILGTERANGNFIRKNLFVLDRAERDPARSVEFAAGIRLENVEFRPALSAPKQSLRVRATWSLAGTAMPDVEATYELVGADGAVLATEKRKPVMNWYPTQKWRAGEFPVDLVKIKIPGDAPEGDYRLRITLPTPDGTIQAIDTGWTHRVSKPDADAEKERLRTAIRAAIESNPAAATVLFDELWYLRRSESERVSDRRLEQDAAGALARSARRTRDAGDEAVAAELAIAARKLDHLDPEVRAICRELAVAAYSRGRALQKQGGEANLDAAYREFTEALRRYPQLSWARRQAEETRPAGIRRRGLD